MSAQVTVANSKGRGVELPRLGHSMNCSEVEVLLDRVRLPTISNYSRFALPVTVVSSDDLMSSDDSSIRLEQFSSMDDEYSPGIFQVRI